MTLYTKYRPSTIEEMVGNTEALSNLLKAIKKPNHSHVYLFSGPPGTGKTTLARIMAKELGADDLGIKELNTANNRGIETAREIMSQMRQSPLSGTSMVFILDECHKWTVDFSNAMLKPLEDTPEHVYFFLCTTDPQKMIKPLRTRCTEIKFDNLSTEQIIKVLKRVVRLEEMDISRDILEDIADKAEGCPRAALVILEQVSSIESEEEQSKYIKDFIVTEDDIDIINLCRALLDTRSTWKDVSTLIKKLVENGKMDDTEKVRYAILGYMNSSLLSANPKIEKRAAIAIESFSEPTYNSGKAGITLAAFSTILGN